MEREPLVTIRIATPDDAADIARVQMGTWRTAYRDLLPAEFLAGLSVERRAITHRINLERRTPAVETFVAESEVGVIGYCSCGRSRWQDGEGELYAIYVLESSAGQGVGTSLFRRCEEWFRDHRFERAQLHVLEGNVAAQGFYERMGWEQTSSVMDEDLGGVVVRVIEYCKRFANS
jgi:ribosomal protein S18 acetylase RimI-like enzyme